MHAVMLLAVCWFVSFVGVVGFQPNIADMCDAAVDDGFSTYTEDLLSSMTNIGRLTVEEIRNKYDGYPHECHQDLCNSSTTNSTEKGNISWAETTVGFRRFVRCPFAYAKHLFAYRDCVMDGNETISWNAENTDNCPLPPFSVAVDRFYNVTSGLHTYTEYNCSTLLRSLSCVLEIPGYHPRDPIFREDHRKLMLVCLDLITRCGDYPGLSTMTLWNASDLLLNQEFVDYWYRDTGRRFLDYLYWIFPNAPPNGTTKDSGFLGENINAFAITYSDNNRSVYFSYPLTNSDNVPGALNISVPENTELLGMHTFLIKPSRLPEALTQDLHLNGAGGAFSMIGPLIFVKINFKTLENQELNVTGETFDRYLEKIPVDITLRDPSFAKLYVGPTVRCARITGYEQLPSSYPVWTPTPTNPWTADCATEKIQGDVNAILCRCNRSTFVAVFLFEQNHYSDETQPMPDRPVTTVTNPPSDVSVFLGFRYVREIYITGEVFKAVSLLCLVLTVLSYAVLREARKGTTTRILLNLCISLIVLIIVLYVAEYQASTRMGCRVMNVFRYYLVLVSLLWNAVEAHNMYKMLIKVFNAETSHFVLIAGILAWGLPAIAVGIGFAVNVETFDGIYDNCIFRCALRPATRLFGWIIPMAVIILHNLIVFAMVMKVIFRTHSNRLPGQTSGKINGGRLCGALTMLVLLGVPWLISAFGIIDAVEHSAEDILQKAFSGILVVFVILQGLFIFIFHCARNQKIRDQLRQHMTSAAMKLRNSVTSSNGSSGCETRLESISSQASSVNVSGVNLQDTSA